MFAKLQQGKDGIAAVSKNTPYLVLLDLGLPDESGHDVLKHLRMADIKFISLHSWASADSEISSFESFIVTGLSRNKIN